MSKFPLANPVGLISGIPQVSFAQTVAPTTTVVPTTTITIVGSGGPAPATGPSSGVPVVVWGLLLLVFGRMAMLLAKPVTVVTDRRS